MKKATLLILITVMLFGGCAHSTPGADNTVPVSTLMPDTEARISAPQITEPDSLPSESTVEESADENISSEPEIRLSIFDVPDTVFVTFDDGPYIYTERVLSALEKYNIKATFFLVGESIVKYPDMARAIAAAGHSIGYHSVNHNYAVIYANPGAVAADIAAWESIVCDTLGYVPQEHLYRFPGGSTCTAIKKGELDALHTAVGDMGYRVFDWTCGNNDRWDAGRREGQSKEDYLKESLASSLVLGGTPHILLLHETAVETVDTLEWTFEYLLSQGYTFGNLSDYDGEFLMGQ